MEDGFDRQRYVELLARAAPVVIETIEEHERQLTLAEELMDKGDDLSPEERKLLELLVVLINTFESLVEPDDEDAGPATIPPPHETLNRLLDARGWTVDALSDVFGNPKIVASVMSGAREISKGQAKELGKLFRVPPKLFLR